MNLALVSMPWAIFNRPSVQLGSLKAYLTRKLPQCQVACLHPYLDVAAAIGFDHYRHIAESPWAAESLYCGLLFPEMQKKAGQVYADSMQGRQKPDYADLLNTLEQELHRWLDCHDFSSCGLLGFSVCFSQLPASLYAARSIKKRWPNLPVVFGGSTCTSLFGRSLLALFPEVDYVVTGEGEQPLASLVKHLEDGSPLASSAVLGKHPKSRQEEQPQVQEIANLADLPLPDYSDYFKHLQKKNFEFIPVLPLEFSRGCWWNKCTFCNLNLQWQGYRYKKAEQMLAEVNTLLQKHQCVDFTFCDNALPVRESDRFFDSLAKSGLDLHFFGEIRTLKNRETYIQYRKGGLNSVQIGIEALSDTLLQKMCKGTTTMDNIAAMKFALEANIALDGNLILDFPGSTAEEVEQTLQGLDKALPFRPLTSAGFFLGYGSPVCSRPEKYGISAVTIHPTNRRLYPQNVVEKLDMLIKSYRGDRMTQAVLWKPVRQKIAQWQQFHANRKNPAIPALSYRDGGSFLIIRQERPDVPTLHHRLKGLSRKIYLACQSPVSKKELLDQFSQVTKEQLSTFLADLEHKNILFCSNDSCLALAVKTP
jgi:ribosomal peptide maturation radical SAM protein 1